MGVMEGSGQGEEGMRGGRTLRDQLVQSHHFR